jgi:hypothetical protein
MGCLRPGSTLSAGRFQSGPPVDDPELLLADRGDPDDAIAKGLSQALARDPSKRKALVDRLAGFDITARESLPVVVTPGVSVEETLRGWLMYQTQHRLGLELVCSGGWSSISKR